ncbi:DUF4038 domain-containing protein [Zobellia sp.]|nr:DUF4038 domain-containing protein [Zobellia sp.]
MILLKYLKEKAYHFKQEIVLNRFILAALLYSCFSTSVFAQEDSYRVMEVVEITFFSREDYNNPYMDVDVWVELKKEGSANDTYRIPVFWDGGSVFRARLVPTSPGNWTWRVINETVQNSDSSFIGKNGEFTAVSADVSSNPNNRGFIRVASNNHTLEYADGTPFFYTADTSWSILTEVFGFDQANNISGISVKDFVSTRKNQGFNGINVIASFPNDSYTELWAEKTYHKKTGPNGEGPFELKSSGQAADYLRIQPSYWQSVDERMQFLSDQGFVTLFETVRRSELWYLGSTAEKAAFYNYVRYLWARYGCYNMIFSWVHHDSQSSIYPSWREMVKDANSKLYSKMGDYRMPYGQPRTAMSFNTSLNNWNKDIPTALDLQNVSNAERDETMHEWLNNIYNYQPAKPALNLEPFYPGWGLHSQNEIEAGLDDTTMAQMQMYGSVLSGGLAGHAWGDAWYAGAATATGRSSGDGGTVVPNNDPQVNALNKFESQAMGHLKSFMLDSDHDYRRLVPAADTNLSDSQDFFHTLSIADDKSFALGFFAADLRDSPSTLPTLTNLEASKTYVFEWWNVTDGGWTSAGSINTNSSGSLQTPSVPNNDRSKSWAYRIRSEGSFDESAEEPEIIEDEVEIEPETGTDFVLRINSGGETITNNGDSYSGDDYFDTGRTLNRPQTGLEDPFKTFRYSPSQVMGYNIPLENGEYTVKLHFAELWFGATGGGSGGAGKRVFDVRLEGELVENNLDVFAQVGAEALLTKTHSVHVEDGELDIDFSSLDSDGGTRHPIINAIEISGIQENVPTPPVEEDPEEEIEEEEIVEEEMVEEEIVVEELPGLVGHWPLDELNGVIASDNSGQNRNGTLERGFTFDANKTSGQIGGALVFDGVDDRISLPKIDDGLQSGFTVSAWVKPSNAEGGYQGVFGSSTAGGFMTFVNRGKLAFTVSTNDNVRKLVSTGTIQNNVWQMITYTYDGTEMLWYINGENVHSEALSGTLKEKSVAWIGWSGWSEEYFEGAIDDVKLFEHALTKQEVSSLFEVGDASTSGKLGLNSNISIDRLTEENPQLGYVHPNPTKGVFRITGVSEGTKQITVTDFSGRVLIALSTDDEEPRLDLSGYPDGVYPVNVFQNGTERTFKVVKE